MNEQRKCFLAKPGVWPRVDRPQSPPLYWRSPLCGGCANLLLTKKKEKKITKQQVRWNISGCLTVLAEAPRVLHRTFNCHRNFNRH